MYGDGFPFCKRENSRSEYRDTFAQKYTNASGSFPAHKHLQTKPPVKALLAQGDPVCDALPKFLEASSKPVDSRSMTNKQGVSAHIEPLRLESRRFREKGLAAHDGGGVECDAVARGDDVSVDVDVTGGHPKKVHQHGLHAQGLADDLAIRKGSRPDLKFVLKTSFTKSRCLRICGELGVVTNISWVDWHQSGGQNGRCSPILGEQLAKNEAFRIECGQPY